MHHPNDPASLERLHDIIEPIPVSLIWPIAPGWWILIVLVVLAVVMISVKWWYKWRADAYRRQALLELQQINDRNAIFQVLKRTALAAYPRESVASLYGKKWISFLNSTTSKALFSKELAQAMMAYGYSMNHPIELQEEKLILAVRQWIISHRPLNDLSKNQDVQIK